MLTLVIGGNHEASHYMRELNFGGWICPNIYFLGAASVINLKPHLKTGDSAKLLRILGISGIFKPYGFF